jgi:acetyl esterase/lipase
MITRLPPLLATALLLAVGSVAAGAETQIIPLWPEGVPGRPSDGGEERFEDGRVFNVQEPTLTYFAPESRTGAAVIVCPGGGYDHLSILREGEEIAVRLNELGVSAFVLRYRLKEYGHPAPLRDVLRAVRLVRSRAAELGVSSDRIGVLGFSAGGHLAATAATLFDDPEGRTGAPLDATSARPDFAVLVYPVITMEDPPGHAGSRQNLLGDNRDPALLQRLSPDLQVTARTPPVFLVHAAGDTAVPLENSLAFYTALRRVGVPAEMHLFPRGGHGFGLDSGLGTTSFWFDRLRDWMGMNGWIEKPE